MSTFFGAETDYFSIVMVCCTDKESWAR